MTGLLLAGALVGLGALLVVRGLLPARQPLAAALSRLRAPAPAIRPKGLSAGLGFASCSRTRAGRARVEQDAKRPGSNRPEHGGPRR